MMLTNFAWKPGLFRSQNSGCIGYYKTLKSMLNEINTLYPEPIVKWILVKQLNKEPITAKISITSINK